MNLVVDIGNTRTKIAVFIGDDLYFNETIKTKSEFQSILNQLKFNHSLVSSVGDKDLTNFVIKELKSPIILDHRTSIPIINDYKTPESLGRDRLANAVAASRLFPKTNCLIIDGGTCLKFDFISKKAAYLGGAISPGLKMRFKSLNTFTENLPLIETDFIRSPLIGKNTEESMISGCYNGMKSEILQVINDYRKDFEDLKIILTGGDLPYLEKMGISQKNSIFADRWLTLRGLNEILMYNAEK